MPIPPVACARARITRNGSYNPRKTTEAKDTVRYLVTSKPHRMHSGAVKLIILLNIQKPKSSKNVLPAVKPDIDNYAKLVMDALNGVLWKDDGQICYLVCRKVYSNTPSIEIWSYDYEP